MTHGQETCTNESSIILIVDRTLDDALPDSWLLPQERPLGTSPAVLNGQWSLAPS